MGASWVRFSQLVEVVGGVVRTGILFIVKGDLTNRAEEQSQESLATTFIPVGQLCFTSFRAERVQ